MGEKTQFKACFDCNTTVKVTLWGDSGVVPVADVCVCPLCGGDLEDMSAPLEIKL